MWLLVLLKTEPMSAWAFSKHSKRLIDCSPPEKSSLRRHLRYTTTLDQKNHCEKVVLGSPGVSFP